MSWIMSFLRNLDLDLVIQAALALALAAVILLLAAAVWSLLLRRDPVWRRLRAISEAPSHTRPSKSSGGPKQMFYGLLKRLSSATKGGEGWQKSKIRNDLAVAGFRSPEAVSIFIGLRIALCFGLPGLGLIAGLSSKMRPGGVLVLAVMAAVLGYLVPSYILEKMGKARANRISKELPNVLDLLVIAVEAGLGLDAAVKRVSSELSVSSPTLAEELTLLSLELKLGVPRDAALRNLARRCGVDELNSLVAMLIQADRFGVSIGRSLRVHSDELRTKRRQKLEEMAAKIPLKLLFPVLFMIFPAIMAVMAGPAVISIMEGMF